MSCSNWNVGTLCQNRGGPGPPLGFSWGTSVLLGAESLTVAKSFPHLSSRVRPDARVKIGGRSGLVGNPTSL